MARQILKWRLEPEFNIPRADSVTYDLQSRQLAILASKKANEPSYSDEKSFSIELIIPQVRQRMCRRHPPDVQKLLPLQQAGRGRLSDGQLARKVLPVQVEGHAARRG